ncbi:MULTISPECIES: metal-dependent hydrolase [Salinibaculum]|uniref:metal-dependent hydrolase n=1 Tax=Salinibaculum TaxID=2732368 RepID=UPI0030D084C5
MWPWGHFGLGYLLALFVDRGDTATSGGFAPTAALAVGTQFPDMVDKPLAWTVSLLPNGRSLAHSVFITALVIGAVVVLARRYDVPAVGTAFGLGYGSHLAGDGLYPLLAGDFEALGFLLWPVVPPIEYSTPQSFGAHVSRLEVSPTVGFEVGLFFVASVLFWHSLRG